MRFITVFILLCAAINGTCYANTDTTETTGYASDTVAAHIHAGRIPYSQAQETVSRPVTTTISLEAGAGDAVDTYLSPLHYNGFHASLNGNWTKALPFGHDLSMSLRGRLEYMRLLNPAGNAVEWQGAAEFDWHIRRGWRITERLTLAAGGGASLYAGALYLPHNGNNPATAKAEVALTGTLSASYSFSIGKLPVIIRNEVLTPMAGIFFSQEYGQPYYNIYLGERNNLIHAGWWGNNFCIDNLLAAYLRLGKGDLGIGYRYRLYSTHVCHLDTRIISHAAVISWTPRHRSCDNARQILAVYSVGK